MSKHKKIKEVEKKNRKRVLYSIDSDTLDLFNNCYKDSNRSKMVEIWMHRMISSKLAEDQHK